MMMFLCLLSKLVVVGGVAFTDNYELRSACRSWSMGGSSKAEVVKKYGSIKNWDISRVTELDWLFSSMYGMYGDQNPDVSNWDTSNIIEMDHGMFTF